MNNHHPIVIQSANRRRKAEVEEKRAFIDEMDNNRVVIKGKLQPLRYTHQNVVSNMPQKLRFDELGDYERVIVKLTAIMIAVVIATANCYAKYAPQYPIKPSAPIGSTEPSSDDNDE